MPVYDYRGFRLRNRKDPRYAHLKYLLFWPIYWLRYPLIEKLIPAESCHPIWCPLDDAIPFVEWFLIPYMLWMVCMLAMAVYTLFYDVESFKRYSRFLIISMSISTMLFLLYPSCQNLRPAEFPRDNLMTHLVGLLYKVDTNTNVFPSEHVIGSIAVFAAAIHTKGFEAPGKRILVGAAMLIVCLSTLFLKQHSVLDVVAAIPVCAVAWIACYKPFCRKNVTIS